MNAKGVTLAGLLELPSGAPKAVAIFAHCFTCSKNIHAASRVSRELAQRGIAVLRFDFTGLGGSGGDFENSDFSSNMEDLIAAATALRDRYMAPSLLVGHSLGGVAAVMAAAEIPEVRAVATIGSPSQPEHVEHLFGAKSDVIERDGAADVTLAGRSFRISKEFVSDIRSHRLENTLPHLGKPIAIFHSPVDGTVSIEHARRIYRLAKHPKSFISIDGADHLLTKPEDASFVAAMLASWASRYIVPAAEAEPAEQPDPGVVTVIEKTGFAQQVLMGSHELISDEPVKVGGTDTGPTPHQLLLAGLGACTSMTIRIYAERKAWPLKGVEVRLRRKQTREQGPDGKPRFIENIYKELKLAGELTAEQKQELARVADRCPVHRTLINEKRISTKVVD